jgi:pyrimidine-nucleoside phosphorylase
LLPAEIIRAKRDGRALSEEAIREFVDGYVVGSVPDYQMAAFCMAVLFRGMNDLETGALTAAMLHSGEVLDLADVPGVKVDKHSTGGVGDKVSLALAPIAAACGVTVPMISGRGLGHTGGTLDKLEAIPGFDVRLSVERFREILAETGACLIGQTERLAPADRRLYALRDVTATVESIPLIASSIMSKKLAEGIDALVLDVKVGQGAFMKTLPDARRLAEALCRIGERMGKRVVALLTGMDEPLGRAIGNALEVKEAVELLRGKAPSDLEQVTLELSAEMVVLAGRAASLEEGRERAREAVASGKAFQKLLEIVRAQGGDVSTLEDLSRLPAGKGTSEVLSPRAGLVLSIDAEALGLAAVALGAGRARADEAVDHGVGLVLAKKVGDRVEAGEPLCTIHHGALGKEPPERVQGRVLEAYRVGDGEPQKGALFRGRIA